MSKASKRTKGGKKAPAKKRAAANTGPRGRAVVKRPGAPLPAAEEMTAAEREHFIETLRASRQLAEGPGPLPPGATHVIETDDKGTARVVRKRYSAL